MDTRFWGPPAWRLLHIVAAHYEPAKQRRAAAEFFEVLPYVLPCKFCRANLTAHYEGSSPAEALDSRADLEKYVYELHKRVSAKLRLEGGAPAPAPAFREVAEAAAAAVDQTPMPVWDFLFSVAYIYPPDTREAPMPDAPATCPSDAADCDRNKWNMLPIGKRLHYWRRFWKLLPGVLPAAWARRWIAAVRRVRPVFSSRKGAVAALWRIRCVFEGGRNDPYGEVCARLSYHASGCGTAAGARHRTCRRLAKRQRQRGQTRRKHSPSKH
jgi:hypothetical protein